MFTNFALAVGLYIRQNFHNFGADLSDLFLPFCVYLYVAKIATVYYIYSARRKSGR